MQYISEKWLRNLNIGYIIYSFSLLFISIFCLTSVRLFNIHGPEVWGFGYFSLWLAFINLSYNFVLLKPFKQYNLWLAYTISYALVSVTNAIMIEAINHHLISYILVSITWILSLLSISLGPLVAISVMSMTGFVIGMIVAKTTTPTVFGTIVDLVAFGARFLLIIIGIYIFRDKFRSPKHSPSQGYVEQYLINNSAVNLLIDSINDSVIIIDQNEVVRSVNQSATELLGQDKKDILDLNFRSILKIRNTDESQIEEDKEPVLQALKTGKSASKEFLLSIKDDQEIFVDISISVIVNPQTFDKYGAILIFRDVSNKKHEESARSEFISTASHEMRTPVAAIEGFIELALNEKVSKVDPSARKYLNKAKDSTQHLGRLFQDLLASSKADDGRISSHPTVVELGELLQQQSEISKMSAEQKGLQLEYIISSGEKTDFEARNQIRPLYYVLVDPDRIKEVATNLIDNAIKYTSTGKLTIGVTGDNDVVQFFVRDSGIGIAEEDINHLFQRFYRIDSSETRSTSGTGLGLYISRKIIELYKGRIWVESKKNEGSTFYVNLPRLSITQAEALKVKQKFSEKKDKN